MRRRTGANNITYAHASLLRCVYNQLLRACMIPFTPLTSHAFLYINNSQYKFTAKAIKWWSKGSLEDTNSAACLWTKSWYCVKKIFEAWIRCPTMLSTKRNANVVSNQRFVEVAIERFKRATMPMHSTLHGTHVHYTNFHKYSEIFKVWIVSHEYFSKLADVSS